MYVVGDGALDVPLFIAAHYIKICLSVPSVYLSYFSGSSPLAIMQYVLPNGLGIVGILLT